MDSGYQEFALSWSRGGVHLLLNHSFVPEILPPGFIAPSPTRLWLNVSNEAMPLGGVTTDLPQYTQEQWFNVRQLLRVPRWVAG